MARRPSPVTRSKIAAAVCAICDAGVKVYGVRVDAGGFTVLTNPLPEPPAAAGEAITDMDVIRRRLRDDNGAR